MKEAFTKLACRECLNGAGLPFSFKMAFQPVIDAETRTIYSHEALVRGPNGEGAATVLAQVNEQNRYRFDQSCRVKAIEAASRLGLDTYLNINFIPGAIYNPQSCIRTTLEAAEEFSFDQSKIIFEVTEGERVTDHAHLKSIFAEYKKQGFQTAIDDFGPGTQASTFWQNFNPTSSNLTWLSFATSTPIVYAASSSTLSIGFVKKSAYALSPKVSKPGQNLTI